MEPNLVIKFTNKKKKVCCNPYNLHTNSKTSNLRSLTKHDLDQLNHGPFTEEMNICSQCRTSKQYNEGAESQFHNRAISPPTLPGSEPMDTDELTDQQHIGQREARLQAEERIAEAYLSQSSTSTAAAPVAEIASTDSMHQIIAPDNYRKIEQIAELVGVEKPTLADVAEKNYKSCLRFEKDVIQKVHNLFGYSSIPTELDEVITNMKEQLSKIENEREKVKYLDLLPDWSKIQIRNTFDDLVTKHTINLMERFKPTASTDQPSRKPGKKPIHTSTVAIIVAYYNQDYISRPFPGRKDYVSVKTANGREKMQKRLLLYPLQDIHKMYNQEMGDTIGKL